MTATGADELLRPGNPVAPAPRRLPALVAVAIVAAAAGLVWWTVGGGTPSGTTVFEVRDQQTGAVLYSREIAVGETFRLEHTHSVTRRPVVETFSVHDPGTLAIEELWFDEFGANLPAGPERIGDRVTTFLHEDGAYRVIHDGHPIGTLPILVGSEAVDHVVSFDDGDRLRLLDLTRAGGHVELAVNEGHNQGE